MYVCAVPPGRPGDPGADTGLAGCLRLGTRGLYGVWVCMCPSTYVCVSEHSCVCIGLSTSSCHGGPGTSNRVDWEAEAATG